MKCRCGAVALRRVGDEGFCRAHTPEAIVLQDQTRRKVGTGALEHHHLQAWPRTRRLRERRGGARLASAGSEE